MKFLLVLSLLLTTIGAKELTMTPIQIPITGNEQKFDSNMHEALVEFYKAFNGKDFALIRKNWLNDEEIVMDNPLGGIKRGWAEIKGIYSRIFSGQAKVYVEFYDYTLVSMDGGFVAIGRERGYVETKGKKLDLAIRTSRVFKLIDGTYKQVHHHGSIESPQLLKEYQELVK
jgi:hypothetical protein